MNNHGTNPRHRREARAKAATIHREEKRETRRLDPIDRAIARIAVRAQREADLAAARVEITRQIAEQRRETLGPLVDG